MKPLILKIAGLQSFREEQEVRFDRLSERGVFGIFGPTGSGKSTILDAVTLALFGKVVRAKNKTQGILNTSEKKLSVSFLFEMNASGEKKKYRVDRRYSRKDEIAVKHDHSRLVEIDRAGLDVVLTEGDSRVTAQVEELLGMKADDFTRAVVLPQGKFAEFLLNLEGIKRKEMLQRLFSLERYGKLLTERLNKRVDRTRLELTGVGSELAGIGNASQETLAEAAKRMEAAKESEGRAAAGYQEARSRFEQAQKIWGLQVELGQVEKDRAAHASRGGENSKAGIALDAAERAAKVAPLVKARDEASSEEEDSRRVMKEAEGTAAGCRAEALAKKDLINLAQERREKESPKLIALKAGLEAAQKLEEEVKGIAAEVQKCKSDRRMRLQDRAGGKEKAEKEDRRKTVLQEGIKQEEKNFALNTVSGSRREKVAMAKQAADRFKAADRTLSAAKVEVQNRQAALTAAGQELAEAEKALAGLDERVRSLRVQEEEAVQPSSDEELTEKEILLINRKKDTGRLLDLDTSARSKRDFASGLKQDLASLESALEEAKIVVQKANLALTSLNRQYNEAYLQNQRILAAKLAAGLVPGTPCPVCGSTDHPHPVPVDIELDTEEAVLEEIHGKIEKAEKESAEAQKLANAAAAAAAGKKAECGVAEEELERIEGEILALSRAMFGVDGLIKDTAVKESELKEARASLKDWREERQRAQKLIHALLEDLSAKKSARAVAWQKINAAKKEFETVGGALEKAGAEWENAVLVLQEALKELGLEADDGVGTAENAAAAVRKMDEAAEAAGKRLKQLREELEQCAKNIEAARLLESDANAALSGLDSQLAEKEKLLAAKQSEINEVTGGRPAAALLAETAKKLETIQTAEDTAKEAHEKAEREKVKAEEDLARKTALLQEALKRLEKCRQDLAGALREHDFVTAKEAEDAFLSEKEIAAKKLIMEAYKDEGKTLAANWERILGLLGEKRITSGQWMEIQNNLEACQTAKDEATKQFVELAKAFRDLSEKHTRWKQLEQRREALSLETSHLDTLKKLLKGDRLVQFLAHEQLEFVVRHATERLKRMTGGRYALLIDSDSNFLIRDDANGSVKRPVTSLSGGETFQSSLAMALALSTQIQLRGQHPLEFFFLDEGFGSLDQNSLEVMVSTLEGLHMERMTIGVISHVGELQQRIGRKLLVEPAESNGRGSRVKLDFA